MAQETKAPPPPLPKIAFSNVLTIERAPRPQPNQQDGVDQGDESQIGAVVIRGNEAVEEERYQEAIERFFGEPLNDEVIERLTDELAQIAKDEGYSYARATIDSEAAALGILQVAIDEGRIDEVRIEGSENTLARDILEKLVGRPARKSEMERALLLVSDIPSLRLRGARLKRETIEGVQRGVLMVELSERGPAFSVGADNYGSENFGPIRARASVVVPDAFVAGDQISGAVRVNPIEPDELVFVSAAYETQVTSSGAVFSVNASAGRTSPGEIQGAGDITGDTRRVGASLSIPIKR
ncbi:MAG: POTRA domain-containing protein, partial [Erythrobacter sp.]